jgi:CRISPR-associated protein Csx10
MKYLSLDLTALSPLAVRADHAPGGANNSPYIAGSTLMGSLAAVHRFYHPEQTSDFERFFLSGQIKYPNLYPATFKHKKIQDEIKQKEAQGSRLILPVYPIPKTAQSCKRFPGFEGDEADDPPHGARDSLFDWAIFELGGQTKGALVSLLSHKSCQVCQKAMHHFDGFYRRVGRDRAGEPMAKARAGMRLQTHTGIDRSTGTVQEGILYNRQVFEEQTRFAGIMKLPDELVLPFEHFIQQVGTTGLVRVGTGRTRGLGKADLRAGVLENEQFSFTSFKERLKAFDWELRTLANTPESKFYFTLTLHSPAILRDSLLRYRGSIDEATIAELVKPSDKEAIADLVKLSKDDFTLIYQNTSVRRVTGWNELWGTPGVQEFAIETGSVFLFAFNASAEEAPYEKLFRLEEAGIGQRRAEGFGRVCISDPFHLEVKLR